MSLPLTTTLTEQVPTTIQAVLTTRVKWVYFDLDNSEATAVVAKENDWVEVWTMSIQVKWTWYLQQVSSIAPAMLTKVKELAEMIVAWWPEIDDLIADGSVTIN